MQTPLQWHGCPSPCPSVKLWATSRVVWALIRAVFRVAVRPVFRSTGDGKGLLQSLQLSRSFTQFAVATVLFDIDGTLISTGGAGSAAFLAAFHRRFGVDGRPDEIAFAGRTDRAIAGDMFRYYSIDASDHHWEGFVSAYLELLTEFLPRHQGTVLPGIIDLIACLDRRDDVAMGLLTGNMARGARRKLAHFSLDHHFAFGGYGDRHTQREDVAAEALAAARRHRNGRLTGPVLVIGDTPADILCGKSIQARTIGVATGSVDRARLSGVGADLVLDDLSDVGPLLRIIDDLG